ncbi:unnamed protein product [Clonostachys chloroleuca]|uniref:Uncharacterized protein n=1 Tax=Clonostachys chloroleuca TaxID=1926264 RepID=A0AA35MEX8_9HYPO|nr:unnamed protein product [Clonostachys chloroleuca]
MPGLGGFTEFNPDKDIPSLAGKVILVTGGTNGIGKATVKAFAKHGPEHIYFTGRNSDAAASLTRELEVTHPGIKITFIEMDLSSLASVKASCTRFTHDRLDILVCNAGVLDVPLGVSTDGFEIHLATNHLGHAMLIKEMLPVLQNTAEAPGSDVRVVSLSSSGHFAHSKDGLFWDHIKTPMRDLRVTWARYGQSKLANLVYAAELARRYPKILSVSVHPGFVDTPMIHNSSLLARVAMYVGHWLKNIPQFTMDQGAFNQLWAAAGAKRDVLINGAYYTPIGVVGELDEVAKSEDFAKRLWDWTNEVLL